MSDHSIKFVPADPHAQPSRAAAEQAVRLLTSYAPEAEGISAAFHEETIFVDAGGSWEGVACPACGADAESWWPDAMDRASETAFADLTVTTPCCATETPLNELRYGAPVAFGRFVLEATNPGIGDTTADQERALAACLGARCWRTSRRTDPDTACRLPEPTMFGKARLDESASGKRGARPRQGDDQLPPEGIRIR